MLTRREGYGLLALLVALLAMSLVGAMAVTANPAQVDDQWRVLRTRDRLARLTDSTTSIVRFREDITNYPGALSHLSTPVTNTDRNLCGVTYGNNAGGNWGGRYAGRLYNPGGTPLPIGLMNDTLEYDATPGNLALVIVVTSVREEQARQLDLKVDGVLSGMLGRVRYTAADAEGLVTMRWRMSIAGC